MNENKYVTLQQFLKLADFIVTGGQAKFFLMENEVVVNGELETRRGRKLYEGDLVVVDQKEFIIHVS
ncbi:MAG: S4 domain-containing protein YaaA [Erysipelotrichaceae bacterium]|nr:S4 domain-containing protein YaaA [Erysipelotrichaceae bacterium]